VETLFQTVSKLGDCSADWLRWTSLVTVTSDEALSLSLGIRPGTGGQIKLEGDIRPEELLWWESERAKSKCDIGPAEDLRVCDFHELRFEQDARRRALFDWARTETIWSDLSVRQSRQEWPIFNVRLREFAAQAVKVRWEVPEPLRALAPAEAPAPRSGLWPWGTHETELLRHLDAAARKFWVRYDPADPTTAPKNDIVTEWLVTRGVALRVAQVMAQILRADGLRPGPRPDRL